MINIFFVIAKKNQRKKGEGKKKKRQKSNFGFFTNQFIFNQFFT
jgi:hypothetical protein